MYCDETGHGRYRGIGVLSGSQKGLHALRAILAPLCGRHPIEWKKIRNSGRASVAKSLVNAVVDAARSGAIRVDVLLWDTEDRRHAVPDRDDRKNLGIMYYHVLKHVAASWSGAAVWGFYPDRLSCMDWDTLVDCLRHAPLERKRSLRTPVIFDLGGIRLSLGDFNQTDCSIDPLLQVADIFAGMGRESRDHSSELAKCMQLLRRIDDPTGQMGFAFGPSPEDLETVTSEGLRHKLSVIAHLKHVCGIHRFGLSLRDGYLRTYRRSTPVNYWWWKSQHPLDRAPTKQTRIAEARRPGPP